MSRLEDIKRKVDQINNLHPAHEHNKAEILEELFHDCHIDWLINEAGYFESLANGHNHVLEENERLRTALIFYADPVSYETNVEDQWGPVVPVNQDAGKRARIVLGDETNAN